jgi:hypothetical protein
LRRELLVTEYTVFKLGRGSITGILTTPSIVTVSFFCFASLGSRFTGRD